MTRVVHLPAGHPDHQALIAFLREPQLARQWWLDAESEAEPDTSYLVAYDGTTPAAWAGYRVVDGLLQCRNNYVRRGYYGRGLYEAAYRARHDLVVVALGLPGETYLYPEPIPIHEADGWQRDPADRGVSTVTGQDHHWQRLTWTRLEGS